VACSPSPSGVSIGYEGLESGFQDAVGLALQVVILVFGVGLLVASRLTRVPRTSTRAAV
jgi:hypothetical protein